MCPLSVGRHSVPLLGACAHGGHLRKLGENVRVSALGIAEWHLGGQEALRVLTKPGEPVELVVERRPGGRIAVGQVDTADEDAAYGRLDKATMQISCSSPGSPRLVSVIGKRES